MLAHDGGRGVFLWPTKVYFTYLVHLVKKKKEEKKEEGKEKMERETEHFL